MAEAQRQPKSGPYAKVVVSGAPVSIAAQIAYIRGEAAHRTHVLHKKVKRGQVHAIDAAREIATLQAILQTLVRAEQA